MWINSKRKRSSCGLPFKPLGLMNPPPRCDFQALSPSGAGLRKSGASSAVPWLTDTVGQGCFSSGLRSGVGTGQWPTSARPDLPPSPTHVHPKMSRDINLFQSLTPSSELVLWRKSHVTRGLCPKRRQRCPVILSINKGRGHEAFAHEVSRIIGGSSLLFNLISQLHHPLPFPIG